MAQERQPAVPRSLVYLLRDVAVAFLIVAVVLGGIFAYTRVWPPMVVVESGSMQHDTSHSDIGVIDTGDLVLVQQASLKQDITTYLDGRATGYSTYGDYGDVMIFLRDGSPDETPIIHRTLVYLQCNSTECPTYSIPALANLPRGAPPNGVWDTSSHQWWNLNALDYLLLYDVGYKHVNLNISIGHYLEYASLHGGGQGRYDGFITMGDHNAPSFDPWLVRQDWVIGRARGELPWFGLIKLTLFPTPGGCRGWRDTVCAAANSWDSLTVALVVLVAAPIVFDVTTALWGRSRGKKGEERDKSKEDRARPGARSNRRPP